MKTCSPEGCLALWKVPVRENPLVYSPRGFLGFSSLCFLLFIGAHVAAKQFPVERNVWAEYTTDLRQIWVRSPLNELQISCRVMCPGENLKRVPTSLSTFLCFRLRWWLVISFLLCRWGSCKWEELGRGIYSLVVMLRSGGQGVPGLESHLPVH